MLDNGFPLATESNILKELIKPPNILRTLANTVTGKSKYVLALFMLIITVKVLQPCTIHQLRLFQCECHPAKWTAVEHSLEKNRC